MLLESIVLLLELPLVLRLHSAGLAAIVGGGLVFHLGFGRVGISSEETQGVSRARGEMDGTRLKEGYHTVWFWWEGWSQILAQVWGVIWWTLAFQLGIEGAGGSDAVKVL